MSTLVHTVHAVLAGAWLGGVLFTTAVVSPALKAMEWGEAERVGVRSAIGNRYARGGTVNLVLLLVFAVSDGLLGGFGPVLYAEYVLLGLLFGLVAAHGAYFGRRLAKLAARPSGGPGAPEKLAPWPESAVRCRKARSSSRRRPSRSAW